MSNRKLNPIPPDQNRSERAGVPFTRTYMDRAEMAQQNDKYGFDHAQKKSNFLRNLNPGPNETEIRTRARQKQAELLKLPLINQTGSQIQPKQKMSEPLKFPPIRTGSQIQPKQKMSEPLKFPPIRTGYENQNKLPYAQKPVENVKLPPIPGAGMMDTGKPFMSRQKGMHYPNLPEPQVTEQLYPNTPPAWHPEKRVEKPRGPGPMFNFMKPTESFQNWASPKAIYPPRLNNPRHGKLPPLVIPSKELMEKTEKKAKETLAIRDGLLWEEPEPGEPKSFRKVRVHPDIVAKRNAQRQRPLTPIVTVTKKPPKISSAKIASRQYAQKILPRQKALTFPEWKKERDQEVEEEIAGLEAKYRLDKEHQRQRAVRAMKDQYVDIMTQYMVREELQEYLRISGISDLIMAVMFSHQRGSEGQLQEALVYLNDSFRKLGVEISMRKSGGKVLIKYFEDDEEPVGFMNLPMPDAVQTKAEFFGGFDLEKKPKKKVICIHMPTPSAMDSSVSSVDNGEAQEVESIGNLDLDGELDFGEEYNEFEMNESYENIDVTVNYKRTELRENLAQKEKPVTPGSEYEDCTDTEEVLVGDQY